MNTDYYPAPDELRDFYINESTSFPGDDNFPVPVLAKPKNLGGTIGGALESNRDARQIHELDSSGGEISFAESFSQWLDENSDRDVCVPALSESTDQPNFGLSLPANEEIIENEI